MRRIGFFVAAKALCKLELLVAVHLDSKQKRHNDGGQNSLKMKIWSNGCCFFAKSTAVWLRMRRWHRDGCFSIVQKYFFSLALFPLYCLAFSCQTFVFKFPSLDILFAPNYPLFPKWKPIRAASMDHWNMSERVNECEIQHWVHRTWMVRRFFLLSCFPVKYRHRHPKVLIVRAD